MEKITTLGEANQEYSLKLLRQPFTANHINLFCLVQGLSRAECSRQISYSILKPTALVLKNLLLFIPRFIHHLKVAFINSKHKPPTVITAITGLAVNAIYPSTRDSNIGLMRKVKYSVRARSWNVKISQPVPSIETSLSRNDDCIYN